MVLLNGNAFINTRRRRRKEWEKVFENSIMNINNLTRKYPADIVYKRLREMSPGKI